MSSFETLSENDKLLYAHALERKGRELVDLLLRKRRVTQELGPLLPPAEQEQLLAKIHGGIDSQISKVQAETVALEVTTNEDPGEASSDPAAV